MRQVCRREHGWTTFQCCKLFVVCTGIVQPETNAVLLCISSKLRRPDHTLTVYR